MGCGNVRGIRNPRVKETISKGCSREKTKTMRDTERQEKEKLARNRLK